MSRRDIYSPSLSSHQHTEAFLESFAREMKAEVVAARNEIKQAQTRHEAALAVVVDQCAGLRDEFEATRQDLSRQLREVSTKVHSVAEQANATDREVVELFKRLDTLLSLHRLDGIVRDSSGNNNNGSAGNINNGNSVMMINGGGFASRGPSSGDYGGGGGGGGASMRQNGPTPSIFSGVASGSVGGLNSSILSSSQNLNNNSNVGASTYFTPSRLDSSSNNNNNNNNINNSLPAAMSVFTRGVESNDRKERPSFFGSSSGNNNSGRASSPPTRSGINNNLSGSPRTLTAPTTSSWRPPWHAK